MTQPSKEYVLSQACKSLGDPVRLQLIFNLADGELTVGELVDRVKASQPSVSKHLSTLKQSGVIVRRQQRNKAFYRLVSRDILRVLKELTDLVEDGDLSVSRDYGQVISAASDSQLEDLPANKSIVDAGLR